MMFVAVVHAQEPVAVTAQTLRELRVDRELRAPASVVAANRANVTSEVTALINGVLVDVGSHVSEGQLLVQLDDANARLALAQARASLAALEAQIVQARQRLKKAEDLLEKDFVSDDELIGRQTDLAVLEANLQGQFVSIELAELSLARTRIKAPFDAAVVERQAQVGSFAMPGTPLMTLVQTGDREVDAEVDPRFAGYLPDGSNLRFVSQGQEWPVSLARLSSVIETNSRVLRARLHFDAEPAAIGTAGHLIWKAAEGLVPAELIVKRGEQLGVFVAEDGRARFVAMPSAQDGRPAVLDSSGETLVVVDGQYRLQDGDVISVSRE